MSGFFLMLLIVVGLFAMLCLSTYLRQPPRRRPRLLAGATQRGALPRH
jgi:hypothetical protein